ncbi:MAG: hypothetical protein FWD70_00845, partial [Desulfuromonadales bacterium]|nr:hypothetical protein [Desulfuromonadales bacterium]
MMNNREQVISRVRKELIGPDTDLFECEDKVNFSDEIIADKPLLRYFSGILYPKQTAIGDFVEDDDENDETPAEVADANNDANVEPEEIEKTGEVKEDNKDVQYSASTFFPSQYGISFAISKDCPELKIKLSFGNYKKAKSKEISIFYYGDIINADSGNSLFDEFGLQQFVEYDTENKLLTLPKELSKEQKQQRSSCFNSFGKDHRNSGLYNILKKLFFKDKYKRYDNKIEAIISISKIKQAENQHYKILLSDIAGVNTENWWKSKEESLKDKLLLHIKLYNQPDNKFIVKVFIENTLLFPRAKFSTGKESLNMACLFQTEIKIETPYLLQFNDYKNNLHKSDEDKMLDFLYREKLSYGLGHNTACTWEDCEDDTKKPTWISSTFLPQFNVKSQSTDIKNFDKKSLEIKQLSGFNKEKNTITSNLKKLSATYAEWISAEENETKKLNDSDKVLAIENIVKCRKIHTRMQKGIELLEQNNNAMRAFQLANTAIYLQMFQHQWHFSERKDGFEAYERTDSPQYTYKEYETKEYPDPNRVPSWRPFQLAFILQCLPSFFDENSEDRDLVDLLYFPTGGGKTEAYLALSAFLIFWRRLQFPDDYGGVNIIIRYTLRLLSAQQFERATKLILACEFIRKNHKDLGNERITIGFWVGGSTIPNSIKDAKEKLAKTQERLNNDWYSINPFQLSNCQWCNTKIISRLQENSNANIGHRINRHNRLSSFCLNPNCEYSETNSEFPIVVVDEDIYENPPTMLFATVDKFAQLAWKGEATSLFNSQNSNGNDNRKPELIIQDELHLLSGPLGSLVGLFENVILSLCTTKIQRPKIIVSTATVKNVEEQVKGLYSRQVQIFPQNATNADDTFFSKTLQESNRRYVGILPTGKTQTMTTLRLNAALLFARLELWKDSANKTDADQFWTILSYFKSLKHIGRFSNKIVAELKPEIKQLQVRYLM